MHGDIIAFSLKIAVSNFKTYYRYYKVVYNLMEVSGYRVEIKDGRHMSNPNLVQQEQQQQRPLNWWSPFSALSAFSPFSTSLLSSNQDRSYVEMEDGKHYGVTLYNGHETRCYATISIDGKKMGRWLLEPYQRATIERPVEIDKKFTFFKVSSEGGKAAGLTKFDSNNGLVQVEFVPEQLKQTRPQPQTQTQKSFLFEEDDWGEDFLCDRRAMSSSMPGMPGMRGTGNRKKATAQFFSSNNNNLGSRDSRDSRETCHFEEGGTGLLGKSKQTFGIADNLVLDQNKSVTITLRLVGRKTPVVDYDVITPLNKFPRSNAVPPPIW